MSIIRNALLYCTIEDGGSGAAIHQQVPVYVDDILYGYISATLGKASPVVLHHGKGLKADTYFINASGKDFICSKTDTGMGTVTVSVISSIIDPVTQLMDITNQIVVSVTQKISFSSVPTITLDLDDDPTALNVEQPIIEFSVAGPFTSWLSVWEKTNNYPYVFDSNSPSIRVGSTGAPGAATLVPFFGDFSIPDAGGWGSTNSTKNTIKEGIIGTEFNSWNFEMKYSLIAIFERLIETAPGLTREDKIFNILNVIPVPQRVTGDPIPDPIINETVNYNVLGVSSSALEILDLILQPLTQFEVTFGEASKLARALTLLPLIKNGKTFNEIQNEMKNPTRIL